MPRPRAPVLLIWILCAVLCSLSLFNAFFPLAQSGGQLFSVGDASFSLVPIFFALPAALIITRQPRNTIGWLLMINPLVVIPCDTYNLYLYGFRTAPPPATFLNLFMIWAIGLSWMALIFPLFLTPLFFPTGRLLSPRWRWTVYLTIGMTLFLMLFSAFGRSMQVENLPWSLVNPIGFIDNDAMNVILAPWTLLLAVMTVASVASMVIRYRRGSLIEREQMKWLLYACFLFGLVYLPVIFINVNTPQWTVSNLLNSLLPLAIVMIPASITIAILRYHLFDIDVIIRLTLVYVLLTGLLGLVYFGGVVLLQQVFRALTGQSADMAVVITTLAIAALFTPLRRRIQAVIDRRFFRQKYNAEQAMARFSVAARGSADLDALTVMLTEITQQTLQPTQVRLYLVKK
jgi:hypothetical protein